MLVSGCGPKATTETSTRRVMVTNSEQAIALAKEEAVRRGCKEIEVARADFERGAWEVMLWQLPKVPGGHAVITVSTNGAIVQFRPGR